MPLLPYCYVDPTNSIVASVGVSNVQGTLPTNQERIGISAAANVHWRTGKGAQTALVTDPMYVAGEGTLVVRVPPGHDSIAFIGDVAGPTIVSVFGVKEA